MRARDKGKEKEPKVKKKPGRTPTSCAECRRLKLRCDKNVPCEKCVSRGCAEICPNGVMASIKGNRMVLSGTEELHERISQLQGRVRDLESALRTMQTAVSEEPHPLLNNDTLRLPPLRPPSQQGSSPRSTSSSNKSSAASLSSPASTRPPTNISLKLEAEEDSPIDAFGTLTIGRDGAAIYIGKTARSEFLIRALLKHEQKLTLPTSHLPSQMQEVSNVAFLGFDVKDDPYVRDQVYKMLPSLSEAVRLCEVYLNHGKFIYTPVTRTELLDEILMTIYQQSDSYQSHHALALLFAVFALASHFDPHKEPYSLEAQEYYQLARTSLGFASPVRQTTLAAIQTLIHMAQYLDLTDSESPSAWMYIGHAVRFAFSIGLHLDASRWSLPQHEIDRRSRVFWQLFSLDTWTSFYLGRPPSISTSFVDCPYPAEFGVSEQETSFHSWSYRFTTLMSSAMASGMGPKQPPYLTILQLDHRIRDFHVPALWRATAESESPPPTLDTQLYRWLILADKETVLLNLHRAYFAQALADNPSDIQHHRYLPSVVAIYRASWRLIDGLQLAWANFPHILARIHLPWSQALSAAIVMCLLVTKLPSCHLSSSAMDKLQTLYFLFRHGSASSKAADTLFPSIQRLCQKAQEAIDPAQHHDAAYSEPPITQTELERLSGKTHLFSENQGSPPSSSGSAGASSSREKLSSHSHHIPESKSLHPIVVEDLKDFAACNPTPSNTSLSDGAGDSETSTPTARMNVDSQPGGSRPPPISTKSTPPKAVDNPPTPSHSRSPDSYFPPSMPAPSSLVPTHAHHPQLHTSLPPQYQRTGFVSGFEPAGTLMLDGTWQGFVEQLGF
ncbi:fungal-specific transcription factor domain-containing protein [Ephemerocybe angulata]|uniref:Fungal-specific transcription factor domain-containing protein n=1 Tax=Ephemerocybe angulata TaxID=980116 RepID=A0A8H6I913_9AGAR|nr:fungal-specific transcription factor domain-containing protein [Tulosesus angulatus]